MNNNNLLSNDDLQDLFDQLSEEEITFEIEETAEMKAARKRYEEYILKHKED